MTARIPWGLWNRGGRNRLRCLLTETACCPKSAVREGTSQRLTVQTLSSLLQRPFPSPPPLVTIYPGVSKMGKGKKKKKKNRRQRSPISLSGNVASLQAPVACNMASPSAIADAWQPVMSDTQVPSVFSIARSPQFHG